MVQLIVSQSCCSKTAKSFTHHALSCRACDLEFWVVPVPFDQRKFEPVIFIEWKAPRVYSKRIPKFSKTFPGIFTVPFSCTREISEFLVEWKAPVLFVFPNFFSTNQEGANLLLIPSQILSAPSSFPRPALDKKQNIIDFTVNKVMGSVCICLKERTITTQSE